MMDKELLAERVVEVLIQAGFDISARCYLRPRSFDLAARKDELLLLFKVLTNIDGLNGRTAMEIGRLANHLLGCPLLVGEKSRDQYLERGAVYFRYGIPTVPPTLADCLWRFLAHAARRPLCARRRPRMRQLRLARHFFSALASG
jgi:putative transcriptional regulator